MRKEYAKALDQIGTLSETDVLIDALAKIRKRGGSLITGHSAVSQLRQCYSDQEPPPRDGSSARVRAHLHTHSRVTET